MVFAWSARGPIVRAGSPQPPVPASLLPPPVPSLPVPPDVVPVVMAMPYSTTCELLHEPASAPAALSPRSTATAVRWTEPSAWRSGSPQLGQLASVLLAWQPQCAQGIRAGAMAA
jgi:hypothetical protein